MDQIKVESQLMDARAGVILFPDKYKSQLKLSEAQYAFDDVARSLRKIDPSDLSRARIRLSKLDQIQQKGS